MKLLRINLHEILRNRLGRKSRYVPGFLITGLEKLVHQSELNEVLETTYPAMGVDFARKVYDYFGLTLDVEGLENVPDRGRFVFASNHPLGGLDGIGLIKILGEKYGDDGIRFLVNDLLMNVEPLRPVFLPVNKFGGQGRAAARGIAEAFDSGRQLVIFPAGLCSRLGDDGRIRDLPWQKSFVQRAIASGRDVIPVKFIGENRRRFYRLARWRKKLGIRFNMEQVFLPAELCAARGKKFRVIFGKPVSHARLAARAAAGESVQSLVKYIRSLSEAL